MLEYQQLVKVKDHLVIGKRYGPLVYTEHHAKLYGKLLHVYKVSSSGTYYCAEGSVQYNTTFSSEMLDVAKYKEGDTIVIIDPKANTVPPMNSTMLSHVGDTSIVTAVYLRNNHFVYQLDSMIHLYPEESLFKLEGNITLNDVLKNYISDESRLQKQETLVSRGERVKGSGVYGRLRKASVQSRCLRDPKAIKGR